MKALFLCSEMAGYFVNCIQLFQAQYRAKVLVVYLPTNPVAPFQFQFNEIEHINKRDFTSKKLINTCLEFKPDIVYAGRWDDKDFRAICRNLKQYNIPVVVGMDNVWIGSIRQRVGSFFSAQLVRPYFSHIWVAGFRQYEFALRLGFSTEQILTGLYAADIKKFETIRHIEMKPYLVYVGRFEAIKGVDLLYEVFNELDEGQRRNWRLKMIGNGTLRNQLSATRAVEIYDFMQPDALIEFLTDAGGFVLPSRKEPWGVVVQEFAAAGKPMILSNAVNSGKQFLIHGYNGFSFKNGDKQELKNALLHFFELSAQERIIMGEHSHTLAHSVTPDQWAAKLASLIT